MNISRIDLNLLVYLDVLLRECNVTRAADQLGLSQPAMSNSLRRLRDLFEDPLLVRTSEGMAPTERARELQPVVRQLLSTVDRAVQPRSEFDAASAKRVFRIMASDYAEATLLPKILLRLREAAPGITLDIMTPSDVSFLDVEQGKVDMAINRFDELPLSFHSKTLWRDDFSCLVGRNNPVLDNFTLDAYLAAQHVWVSKTGMGIGVGVDPDDVQRLGWVDEALTGIGETRRITMFTRHYQAAMLIAETTDLIVTLPSKAAQLKSANPRVAIRPPPFPIPPIDLTMAWSPLLHHNPAHRWMRQLTVEAADEVQGSGI